MGGWNGQQVVVWVVVLEWMAVEVVVVKLLKEVVALRLEVVKVQVWVEIVGWLCESWMPQWSRSCVEVQE